MKKFALVTGASSGLGLSAIGPLIENGYMVLATVRNEPDAHQLTKSYPQNCKAILMDVQYTTSVKTAFTQIEDLVGQTGLQVLVNNAGIAVAGPLEHLPIAEFQRQLDVNLTGVLRTTQAFLPLLRRSKEKARIIQISSVSGLFASAFLGAYAASKFGLEGMSDALRRELAIWGIKVIILEPGPIKTRIWGKSLSIAHAYENTAYGPILKKADEAIIRIEEKALPTRRFSQVLVKAVLSSSPRKRYIIHKYPILIRFIAHFIPSSWIDYFVVRRLKKIHEASR